MISFPLWKRITVLVVMLGASLLALPNFFGDAPALQLSRKDRGVFEDASTAQFERLLRREGIPYEDAYVREGRLWLRFAGVPEQMRARDAIARQWESQYAVATTFAPRAPQWITTLGLRPMSLGLDLRGGIYLVYEVDVQGAVQQLVQVQERDLRKLLRDRRIQYVEVAASGTGIGVTLRDERQRAEAAQAIRKYDAQLLVDADGPGPTIRVRMTEDQIRQRQDFAIQQNITALSNRVDALGVAEAIVQRQGLTRISVQLPGIQDASEVVRVLGKVATLEFRLVDAVNSPAEAARTGRAPLGSRLYKERGGNPVLLKRDVIATGEQLVDATSSLQQGEPSVDVVLDGRGGEEMLRTTRENLGKPMAVVFIEKEREQVERDGRKVVVDRTREEVISVATIRGVFSNRFQITGLSVSEGQELAKLLRAGALAAPLYIVEQRLIGPSLGQDNIDAGRRALIVGAAILFVFMIAYYRTFGVIAVIVLLSNIVLITAALGLFGAALTLPGIAGMLLTVGTSVDANILIYERIREELRLGNSPGAAITAGFDRAFSAIADSNVTMFMSGIVLFAFGTGPLRGFAVTMCIGIVASMFTALLGSRALIHLVYGHRRRIKALAI